MIDYRLFLSTLQGKIVLLIGQIIVVILCIGYIEFIYYSDILPDKVVSETYVQTQCVIADEQVAQRGKVIHHYQARFLIQYIGNGTPYNVWVSGNGLDRSYSSSESSQEDVLSGYQVGETYPCWYNPKIPQIAVLVLRHSWSSTFPLFIPSVILLIVLYYLWRSIYDLAVIQRQKNK